MQNTDVKSSVYARRRQQLREYLEDRPYIISAFDELQQTNDSSAPFIQEANFYYLTGIEESGWLLIVDAEGRSTLVAPDVSEVHRIFDGGLSDEQALSISEVDSVVSPDDGVKLLAQLFQTKQKLGVIGPDPHEEYYSFVLNPAPARLYDSVKAAAGETIDIRQQLAKMRGHKSEDEIEKIRHAVHVTGAAFTAVKASLETATYEYNLEAQFSFAFRNQGLTHAYEPIVAGAGNACTLHYNKNSARLPENGLVLMDVGARYEGYAADITRTYAIGTPTERQVAVHAAVEKAHFEIIALLKPGLSVKEYHEKVDEIMKGALKSLGLLSKPEDYRKYFPHSISHGLGLDVHDSLGGPKVFEPGMVFTVEPGIYIPEEEIGVRIEDDILITEDGHENLSGHLPTSL